MGHGPLSRATSENILFLSLDLPNPGRLGQVHPVLSFHSTCRLFTVINQTQIFGMDAEAIAVEKLDIDDEKIEINKVTEINKPSWATCGW